MGAKIKTPKKSLGLPTKPQKSLDQKLTSKNIPCRISEPQKFPERIKWYNNNNNNNNNKFNNDNNNNNNNAILYTDGLYHARWFSIGHCENITR